MAVIPRLDIPSSPRTLVFRAMEKIVRYNSVFQRTVKPDKFRTWDGHPRDTNPFSYQEAPCIRWTPTNGPEKFETPNMMTGSLFINCEVICAGSCVDDMFNIWWMIEACFYPGGNANLVIQQTLRDAGAHTGLVLFSQPAFDVGPDGVFLAGSGQLTIDVRFTINT